MVSATKQLKNAKLICIAILLGILYCSPLQIRAQLSGNYDIGVGSPDPFKTLTSAVQHLKEVKMYGPVTFTLVDPSYPNESFPIAITDAIRFEPASTLPFTIKVRSQSTIRFEGFAISILVLWTHDVTVDGSYLEAKRLLFKNTATGNSTVLIENDGDGNNVITNCIIEGPNSNSGFGLSLNGPGKNTVSKNIIRNVLNGIRTQYYAAATIEQNRIYAVGQFAIALFQFYNPARRSRVINNQISITSSNSAVAAGVFDNSASIELLFNSIYIKGTQNSPGGPSHIGFYENGWGENIIAKNNIFYCTHELYSDVGDPVIYYAPFPVWLRSNYAFHWEKFSHNLYVGVNRSRVNGINAKFLIGPHQNNHTVTFAAWKSTLGDNFSYETNTTSTPATDLFVDPEAGDLHINENSPLAWLSSGRGSLTDIGVDFDGDLRSTIPGFLTDIGSDEFEISVEPPPATLSAPPAPNTATAFAVGGTTLGSISWGSIGTPPLSINFLYYSGSTPPNAGGSNFSSFWTIVPTGGSNYTYSLRLYYSPAEVGSTEAGFRTIVKREVNAPGDSSAWALIPSTDYPNATPPYIETSVPLTSFSLFSVHDTRTPLESTQPPIVTCPATITLQNAPDQCGQSVAFGATATGTPPPTIDYKIGSTSITSPHTFPVGTTTVTCTATNGVGNPSVCSFVVNVQDIQHPTITCPADVVIRPTSLNGAVHNYQTPVGADNCSVVITQTGGLASGLTFPIGTTTNTFLATDPGENDATCSFRVTVVDPHCTPDKVYLCHNGNTICVSVNAMQAHLNHGDLLGPCSLGKIGEEVVNLPDRFGLEQNYPNPFNPTTTIRYALPVDAHVTIAVFNMLGQVVAQLVDGLVPAGFHETVFDASELPSGIYIYRLNALNFIQTQKLVLVK